MGIQFLRETEASEKSTVHCCVCNRLYSERENIGWVYRSLYKVYTCSNECYTSDEYKMLLTENNTNG